MLGTAKYDHVLEKVPLGGRGSKVDTNKETKMVLHSKSLIQLKIPVTS